MLAWLFLSVAVAADTADPKYSGYAIPVAGVDTDDGFGGGGRLALSRLSEGYAPYKWNLVLHAYVTTTGYHHHRIRYDRTGLGERGRLRISTWLAWRQWLKDGYWGIGDGTTRVLEAEKGRFFYSLFQPFAHVTARYELTDAGDWELFGAVNPKYSIIDTELGSLLYQERPYGLKGGSVVQGFAGVLHDTRQPEIAPTKGHLYEVSGRVAPKLSDLEEAGGFGGTLLQARGFTASGDRVVWAGRVMGEYLFGQVPFYEMVHWGGAMPVAGFGGQNTLRGVQFGRWRAPGKAIANGEMRVRFAQHELGRTSWQWEWAPFVDVGAVFGGGRYEDGAWPVHPAAGMGIRPILDQDFVGRIDVAVGVDDVRDRPFDPVRQRGYVGFYLAFDHAF